MWTRELGNYLATGGNVVHTPLLLPQCLFHVDCAVSYYAGSKNLCIHALQLLE